MTTDTIKLLARYNAHVNNEMNDIIAALKPDEWEREFGGFYKSIKSLCSHIYLSDVVWLKRFAALRPFESLKNPIIINEYSRDGVTFADVNEYREMRSWLDSIIGSFSEEIAANELRGALRYKNWKGEEQNRNVGGLLLHMFNHQTHHRGMISLYLDILGKENDFSNLAALV